MRKAFTITVVATVVGGALVATSTNPVDAQSPQVYAAPSAHAASSTSPSWFARHGVRPTSRRTAKQTAGKHVLRRAPHSRLDPAAASQPAAPNGTVRVSVTGSATAVREHTQALHGRVLVSNNGTSIVVVPRANVSELSQGSGVSSVDKISEPHATADPPSNQPSQAVAASGADAWQNAGTTGAGAKIAIVDLGFGLTQQQYDDESNAGHLGTGASAASVVNVDCADAKNNPTAYNGEDHGLAVAELAHQQAPDAQLTLYCVNSPTGLAQAELDIENAGIKIVSHSVEWFADSRGDGTGPKGSVAATVQRARQHGILWINASGNDVPQHWGGSLADVDKDGYLDLGNHSEDAYPYESNFFYVAPGSASAPSDASFIFQWDNWPTTTHQVTLQAYGEQCTDKFGTGGTDDCHATDLNELDSQSKQSTSPVVGLDIADFSNGAYLNKSQYPQIWEVQVKFDGSFTSGARYDLLGVGDLDGASDLACPTADANDNCNLAAGAIRGSESSPANSPYAMAVGAADVGADGSTPGALESFSSQGPTIDGRTSPQITGWDGLSSYVYPDGFYGTSAATPTVAGAAALVEAANPNFDAAQMENFLDQRASASTSRATPINPPTNAFGHGLLTLGATPTTTPVTPPRGSGYQALTAPTRLLDTRTMIGKHHSKVGSGGTVTVTDSNLPTDATAVAVNLTGVGAVGGTYLSAYPAGSAFPGTSNLNLSKTDPIAAVFAIVTVENGSFTIRNNYGPIDIVADEVGYFGTGAEPGLYKSVAPAHRVLDTRGTTGGHKGALGNGKSVTVNPALPAGATAAVVNVTTADTARSGFVSASPTCSKSTSTLNFGKYVRANLAVVGLKSGKFCITDGSNSADVIVDVVGYLGASGAKYVALPSAYRIVDTRTGNGGNAGGASPKALGSNASAVFYGANVRDVPASAAALFTGVVEAAATNPGFLTLFPGATKPSSLTSNINFTPGRIVSNAAISGLSTGSSGHQFGIYNHYGSTQAAADVFGYFVP